ncbi:MAG TPA: hypothetical protein VLK84_20865 [Longimicrobium sp.]|nr:hypothetical protein [Longimicrobium sp.]
MELRFRVDAEGAPGHATLLSSTDPHLDPPSPEALQVVRFHAVRADDRAVPVWVHLPQARGSGHDRAQIRRPFPHRPEQP